VLEKCLERERKGFYRGRKEEEEERKKEEIRESELLLYFLPFFFPLFTCCFTRQVSLLPSLSSLSLSLFFIIIFLPISFHRTLLFLHNSLYFLFSCLDPNLTLAPSTVTLTLRSLPHKLTLSKFPCIIFVIFHINKNILNLIFFLLITLDLQVSIFFPQKRSNYQQLLKTFHKSHRLFTRANPTRRRVHC
jgi:hypothetical protein